MSLSSLLSIARSALLTQQKAIDVTGHNVANASTDGYTRQRLRLTAADPLVTPIGQLGRGVVADGIERVRDQFLDASYRKENGDYSRFSTTSQTLSSVDGIFGEPSDTGLASALDGMWSAFGDLANDPTSQAARELARQAGADVARRFQSADSRLAAIQTGAVDQMRARVDEVNGIMQQIADLNTRIRSVSAGQREAPDVKDTRDRLIDRLSSLVGVRVLPRTDGTVAVAAGDALLVDGGQASAIELRDQGNGQFGIGVKGGVGTINVQGGEIGALVELSTRTLPGLRADLSALAKGIVTEVNALHVGGKTLGGATGINFFNPTGLTAASMQLSAEVQASTDNIAAGQSGGVGDNAIALAIAGLRSQGVASFGGQSIDGAYQQLVSRVGVLVRDASDKATAQEAVVSHVNEQRQGVSGVSTDEELTNLIQQQNAFAAAARLVTVADDMMQAVIGMVR